jgi:hypothetical protein
VALDNAFAASVLENRAISVDEAFKILPQIAAWSEPLGVKVREQALV